MAGHTVAVRVTDLEDLARELDEFRQRLDDIARLRVDAVRLRTRVQRMLSAASDPEKTPIRPPSSEAFRAFESSSKFVAVRPPARLPEKP